MSLISKKPPEFRHGTKQLNVKHLNQIRDMQFRQVSGGVGVSVSDFGDRTVVGKPDERIVNPYVLMACAVVQEFDDYLLCLPLNISTPASPLVDPAFIATPPVYNNNPQGAFSSDRLIYIAKPWMLQRKPFEGQTISVAGVDTTYTYPGTSSLTVDPPAMDHTGGVRTATPDGGSGVTETIWPPYIIGDIITAVYRFTGYYDPNQVNQTSPASGDPLIEWQDLNEAGRTWREPSSGGSGSITAREVDGTPSLGGITTLEFDQADGFVVSSGGTGVARVDLSLDGQTINNLTVNNLDVNTELNLNSVTVTSTSTTWDVDTNSIFNFTGSEIYMDAGTTFEVYKITYVETTTPGTPPPTGRWFTYIKSDGTFWIMDSTGAEKQISVAGAGWIKIVVDFDDFTAAATSEEIVVYTLPIRGVIEKVAVKHTVSFTGGGATTAQVNISNQFAAPGDEFFATDFDVFQIPSNTMFDIEGEDDTNSHLPALYNFGATTPIKVKLTSNVNVNTLTAGSVTLWLKVSVLP